MTHSVDWKQEVKKNLEQVTALRDEIRVKLHLAKLDAKDVWNQIETELPTDEKAAEDTSNEAARAALSGLIKRLEKLRSQIQ